MNEAPVTSERLLALWLRFLHSFALSDHLGDASESVRSLGEMAGLPVPPDDADLDQWVDWVKTGYGINEGLSTLFVRERDSGEARSMAPPAPTLQQRLDAYLRDRGF